MIWLIPVGVVVVGIVPVAIAGVRALEEWRRVVWELRKLGTLRPALVEVGAAGRRLQASAGTAFNENGRES